MRRPELWLLVLARDPSGAKSRLAGDLRPTQRAALALAMLEDVLRAARAARLARVLVVSESAAVRAFARARGVGVIRTPARGAAAAARAGLRAAAARGCRHALVLPSDLPLLTAASLRTLAWAAARSEVVLVPDRHRRGTNALLLSPPLVLAPRFGPRSFPTHRAAATRAGLRTRVLTLPAVAFDLDTLDDLRALRRRRRGIGSRTAAVLAEFARGAATQA
jgi:2-phospho-L-lactate/phosphoenolpyruvate guanylyltransferase